MVFAITVAAPAAGGAIGVAAAATCVGGAATCVGAAVAALLHAPTTTATARRPAANLMDVFVSIVLFI
jgi:hypothetical protein